MNTLLPDEFSSKVTVKTDFCVDALIGDGLNLTVYVKEDQSISGTKIVTTAGDHQLSVELVTDPKQDRTVSFIKRMIEKPPYSFQLYNVRTLAC